MKHCYRTLLFCTALVFYTFSFPLLHAQNENRLEDFTHRNVYLFNEDTQDWILQRSTDYAFMDTGRTIKTELFDYLGQKEHDEETFITYDDLGRIIKVETWTNERGDFFRYRKERYAISYFKDTEIIQKEEYFVKPNYDREEVWYSVTSREFDENDNMTLYLYKKNSRSAAPNDSIVYEYDDEGRLETEYQYNWNLIDCCTYGFTLAYRLMYSYDNVDNLQSILVDYWNRFPGEWVTYQRIVDIEKITQNSDFLDKKDGFLDKDFWIDDNEFPEEILYNFAFVLKGFNYLVQNYDWDGQRFADYLLVKSEEIRGDLTRKVVRILETTSPEVYREFITSNRLKPLLKRIEDEDIMFEHNIFTYNRILGAVEYVLRENNIEVEGFKSLIEDYTSGETFNTPSKSINLERKLLINYLQYDTERRDYVNWVKQEFFYNGERIYNSVEDKKIVDNLIVYPNPTKGTLQFTLNNQIGSTTIELVNALGQTVMVDQVQIPTSHFQYFKNVQHLESGVYILKISTPGVHASKKVILQ